MECNRDEAKRAKEIAENKIVTKDFALAKKFALKAQTLYPELDGISQLVATLDIYVAAENKINNESDFYAILGVNPSADDDTVRKHYRKLALFLHPDKNKSVGADGAFKHISEAWSLLSDKTKRSMYDQRRNANVFKQTTAQNGFYHNFTKSTTTRTKGTTKDSATTSTGPTSDHKQTHLKTFWTVCHGCKMQYEYLRMYLHQNLLCPNCHEPFLAMETPAPNTKISTKGLKTSKGGGKKSTGFQWVPFSKTTDATSSAQAMTMVQRAYERVKREKEEARAALRKEEALRRKKKRSISSSAHLNSMKRKQGAEGLSGLNQGDFDSRKTVDIHTQLIDKARIEIRKKLHEWKNSETMVNSKTAMTKEEEKQVDESSVNLESTKMEAFVMDVADPDFHNFGLERCETCFREGDVWAAYDDDDGMPRNYALIHKVISMDPFKIKVWWLNSRTNNETDMFSGFSKEAFGEFRTGKNEIISVADYFSHKVHFTSLENRTVQVYPSTGDVWALYRDWSADWNEETPSEVKHKYEIVQVDETDEEVGFTVTQLVKVAGFKTVFHRHLNPKDSRTIPVGEIFRFSHRIPSYMLTGQESADAPKGCCELDPAAIPEQFLQVIPDLQDEEHMDEIEIEIEEDVKEVVDLID